MKSKMTIFSLLALLFAWGLWMHHSSVRCNGSQLTGNDPFLSFCKEAALRPEVFSQFKRDPIYRLFYENTPFEVGSEMVSAVEKRAPELLESALLERLRLVDRIGSPFVYQYDPYGPLSPTTAHQLKVVGDLFPSFKDAKGLKVVEIGGGNGNLCKLLHEVFDIVQYTIVALKEEAELVKKHLGELGLHHVRFVTPENVAVESSDLLVSFYTFAEVSLPLQKRYIRSLFSKADTGYLVCNFLPKHFGVKPMSRHALMKCIKSVCPRAQALLEEPLGDRENYVLSWGKIL